MLLVKNPPGSFQTNKRTYFVMRSAEALRIQATYLKNQTVWVGNTGKAQYHAQVAVVFLTYFYSDTSVQHDSCLTNQQWLY